MAGLACKNLINDAEYLRLRQLSPCAFAGQGIHPLNWRLRIMDTKLYNIEFVNVRSRGIKSMSSCY